MFSLLGPTRAASSNPKSCLWQHAGDAAVGAGCRDSCSGGAGGLTWFMDRVPGVSQWRGSRGPSCQDKGIHGTSDPGRTLRHDAAPTIEVRITSIVSPSSYLGSAAKANLGFFVIPNFWLSLEWVSRACGRKSRPRVAGKGQ
jgi:hypothetical protein